MNDLIPTRELYPIDVNPPRSLLHLIVANRVADRQKRWAEAKKSTIRDIMEVCALPKKMDDEATQRAIDIQESIDRNRRTEESHQADLRLKDAQTEKALQEARERKYRADMLESQVKQANADRIKALGLDQKTIDIMKTLFKEGML